MLRLAIWFENRLGRADGNPTYITAALKRKQDKNELEIEHLIPDRAHELYRFGTFDAHLWVDWGEDGLTGLLPYKPVFPPGKPLVYWASDTHIHDASYGYRLSCARQADIVFCAQKRAVEEFKVDGIKNPIWLPHAFEPSAYCDPDSVQFVKGRMGSYTGEPKPFNFLTKKYDVCFVGHVNSKNRIDFLKRMFKEFPNFFFGQRLFNEACEKYARSKVCLNISMTDDINMRCFEVCGSKSLLLTNWLPTIEELGFKDGENCAIYKNFDEAVEKAKFYVEHDDEREKVVRAGYYLVKGNHTIDHRASIILDEIKKLMEVPQLASV